MTLCQDPWIPTGWIRDLMPAILMLLRLQQAGSQQEPRGHLWLGGSIHELKIPALLVHVGCPRLQNHVFRLMALRYWRWGVMFRPRHVLLAALGRGAVLYPYLVHWRMAPEQWQRGAKLHHRSVLRWASFRPTTRTAVCQWWVLSSLIIPALSVRPQRCTVRRDWIPRSLARLPLDGCLQHGLHHIQHVYSTIHKKAAAEQTTGAPSNKHLWWLSVALLNR